MIEHPKNPLITYALFAGAGGMHLGLQQAYFDGCRFEVTVATDINPLAERTHKMNWPNLPFLLGDVRQISAQQLLDLSDGRRPDVICGGPPCQGFSTLGDKLSSDPRNDLFLAFARLVKELEPSFVILENVKSLTTMYQGQYKNAILKAFSDLGYEMNCEVLNAADYGVPQVRQRTFFVGTRLPQHYVFPAPTHGEAPTLRPYRTVGQAITDLADKGAEVPNHLALNHSEKVIERYKLIPEGGRLPAPEALPEELRRRNFGNTYKRLHSKRPALTMVPGNNAFPVHPWLHRSLTPREAARLQTFPDTFLFAGDRRSQCILVGNAVPPLLGQAIGESLLRHLRSEMRINNGREVSSIQKKNIAFSSPQLFEAEDLASIKETTKEMQDIEAALQRERLILPTTQFKSLKSSDGFVDLFCGAGGFTLGFGRAGWRPLLCVDSEDSVVKTHAHNFPSVPVMHADLSQPETVRAISARFRGQEVGVVVGGPPCQGFSIFGQRRFVNTRDYNPHDDARNQLVYSFVEVVRDLNPRWFVMENVPGLANLDQGLFLRALLEEFRAIGYDNVEARVLLAADYGVPQLRRRLLIVGNRTGHIVPWPKKKFFDKPKDWQDAYRTVGEVTFDLADESSYQTQTCHVPMNHKPLLVERYGYIPEGGKLDVDALPEHLKSGYRTKKVKNYSHVFRRLHREEPSITIVPGHNALPIHPFLDRALTVREAARIQTFPDALEFVGTRQQQCIQVGNAFPPLLAHLIANNIRKAESNGWFPQQVPTSAFYSLVERDASEQKLLFELDPEKAEFDDFKSSAEVCK